MCVKELKVSPKVVIRPFYYSVSTTQETSIGNTKIVYIIAAIKFCLKICVA